MLAGLDFFNSKTNAVLLHSTGNKTVSITTHNIPTNKHAVQAVYLNDNMINVIKYTCVFTASTFQMPAGKIT